MPKTCDINFLFFLSPVLKQRTAVIIHSEVSNLNSSFFVLQDLKQMSDNFAKPILVFLKTESFDFHSASQELTSA